MDINVWQSATALPLYLDSNSNCWPFPFNCQYIRIHLWKLGSRKPTSKLEIGNKLMDEFDKPLLNKIQSIN